MSKYLRPVPRYTSYPTAPHFNSDVGPERYADWLGELPDDQPLSIYVHIPFCDTLCWFCGCHTKIVARYDPVQKFLRVLIRELDLVSDVLGGRGRPVSHIHWGGGSPTMLTADDIRFLGSALQSRFNVLPHAEFAIETDPRDMDAGKIDALADIGVTRASIGVQDSNADVQAAINRIQTMETTADCVDALRNRGIRDINIDLIYGLPQQSVSHVKETVRQVVSLAPSRLALFGYAHVPWVKSHQKMIDESALPNASTRAESAETACKMLRDAGYREIGLDHFAHPEDPMTSALNGGNLKRNFQGYTTDTATALIGLGPSAIGSLPQGYAQNHLPLRDYARSVDAGNLPISKGIELTEDDKVRREIITDLMCFGSANIGDIAGRYGKDPAGYLETAKHLSEMEKDGLIDTAGWDVGITDLGKPFRRAICAEFDAHLARGEGRHSLAI